MYVVATVLLWMNHVHVTVRTFDADVKIETDYDQYNDDMMDSCCLTMLPGIFVTYLVHGLSTGI